MEDVFLERLVFRILILYLFCVLGLLCIKFDDPGPAWSKVWVCDSLLPVNAGSNSAGNMDICLLWVLSVVK
jgi:hypothetical protein